ncbi:MAG TPA: hypothetical protein VK543_06000 [Puia sp.]|nr:hypothetical protein [Puia sp.]
MRVHSFLPCLLLVVSAGLQSCSKSTPKNNSGTDSVFISPPASKYMVETYAGGTTLNSLSYPGQMCVDSKGFLYVSETNHNCIVKIDPLVQLIGPFAGMFDNPGCTDDPFGSGSPSLTFPENLWINSDDQIFIGDYGCGKAKVANTTGSLTAIGYDNPYNLSPDPSAACQDFAGNTFLLDTYDGVFEIRAADQVLVSLLSGDDVGIISSMTMDGAAKNMYISANHRIQEISDGKASTIAGDSLGNRDGVGHSAAFGGAMVICMGTDGNIYVADTYNNEIRQVTPGGSVTTIAGDGKAGFANGPGDKAEFNNPSGIAFTTIGNNNILYVSDGNNNVIRKITFPK